MCICICIFIHTRIWSWHTDPFFASRVEFLCALQVRKLYLEDLKPKPVFQFGSFSSWGLGSVDFKLYKGYGVIGIVEKAMETTI